MLSPTTHRMLEYLGDGAYVHLDSLGDTVICTSNGVTEENVVVLEDSGVATLERWLERRKELIAAQVENARLAAIASETPDGD